MILHEILLEYYDAGQEERLPRPNPLAWDLYELLKSNRMVIWNPRNMPGTTVYIRSIEPTGTGRFDKQHGFVGSAQIKCSYIPNLGISTYLKMRAAKKRPKSAWKSHTIKVKPGTENEWAVQPAFHIADNVYELSNLQ